MPLVECRVEMAPDAVGVVEGILGELGASRWVILEDRLAGRAWVVGYFLSRAAGETAWKKLAAALDPRWLKGTPNLRELRETEWRNSYRAHFLPWHFGRLHWVPVWERGSYPIPQRAKVVWLDPGMAFGTGNHETTRLCCERLIAYAGATEKTPRWARAARRVVDAGCGSGILAISAVRLGFGPVVGFDNDPEAVKVSRRNAAHNGMAGRVQFFRSDLAAGLRGRRAGLILANIQAEVLIRHASDLARSVAPGGQLVLGGILARELSGVRDAFVALTAGWRAHSRVLGEWADLALTRSY